MLRYIRVNGKWIDTLTAQRDEHIVYIVIDDKVINAETGDYIGKLQEESDDGMPL